MSTQFDYVNEYASLGVNLNRQKQGPLDGSSVFKSLTDFTFYIIGTKLSKEAIEQDSQCSSYYIDSSDYVKNMRRYAYVGQVVSIVDNNEVSVYKILDVPTTISDAQAGIANNSLYKRIDDASEVVTSSFATLSVAQINLRDGSNPVSVITAIQETNGKIQLTGTTLTQEMVSNLTDDMSNLSTYMQGVSSTISNFNVTYDNLAPSGQPVKIISKLNQTGGKITALTTILDESGVSNLTTDLGTLSSLISSKIFIKNYDSDGNPISAYDNLSVIKLTDAEYNELIYTGEIYKLSNAIFIVSSDIIDAHQMQIRNVADGTALDDAVTLKQLSEVSSASHSDFTSALTSTVDSLSVDQITLSSSNNPVSVITEIEEISGKVSITATELTQSMVKNLTTDLGNISNEVSTKVFVKNFDQNGNPISGYDNLSVIKITEADYAQLVYSGEIYNLSNAVFIVSSDIINAYGLKIKNLANGTSPNDAATVGQVTQQINHISSIAHTLTAESSPISVITNLKQTDGVVELTVSTLKEDMISGLTTDLQNLSTSIQNLSNTISSLSVDPIALSTENVVSVITKIGETGGKISVQASPLTETMVSGLIEDLKSLSNSISTKVFIRNYDDNDNPISGYSDISVLKVTEEEYYDLVCSGELSGLSNVIFILSSDYVNAYGMQVRNVADGERSSDAATVNQLNILSIELSKKVTSQCTVQVSSDIDLSSFNDGINEGDIAILKNTQTGGITGYVWAKSGTKDHWEAMVGNYTADTVYFNENLTMAGNYEKVGNIELTGQNQVLSCKGWSVSEMFSQIFDVELQPANGTSSDILISLTNGSSEIGSTVTPQFKLTFKPGTFNYSWTDKLSVYNGSKMIMDQYSIGSNKGTTPVSTTILSSGVTPDGKVSSDTVLTGTLGSVTLSNGITYNLTAQASFTSSDYAVTNKGAPTKLCHLSGTTAVKTSNNLGVYRRTFYYTGANDINSGNTPFTSEDFTSQYITSHRSGSYPASDTSRVLSKNISISAGTMLVWYAVEGTAQLTNVTDVDGQGLDIKDNFINNGHMLTTMVGGVGNLYPTKYTVFYNLCDSSDGFTKSTYQFRLK